MQTVLSLLLRLVLLAAGLVFAASLALAVLVLFVLWGLRALWGRLTGRPVAPFVMRMDPRGGFGRFYRTDPGAAPAGATTDLPGRRSIGDVTDVEPKAPRD